MRMLAAILLWLLALSASANSWARFSDGSLNEWLGDVAVPGLVKTLSQHPRFKGESVRVAILEDGEVAAQADGLSIATRDAVHTALMAVPGLRIAQSDGPETCATRSRDGYFLAVSAGVSGARSGNVQLRIYDIVEREWVSGFTYLWRGELNSKQREAARRTVTAASARGMRVAPFTADQSDLLAEKLAADLACQLAQSGDDELTVQPVSGHSAALIAGNLAGRHGIPVAAAGKLLLATRVHKVNESLYQVWAILSPAVAETEPASLTSSAYAVRPLLQPAAGRTTHGPAAAPPQPVTPLLSRLSVVSPARPEACGGDWADDAASLGSRPVISAGQCFALRFSQRPGARAFVFRHGIDSRLASIPAAGCSPRQVGAVLDWQPRGGTETFYVLSTGSARAAARIDRILARLPDDCEGAAGVLPDSDWLDQLDAAVRDLGDDVAWRSVRVYHQPAADTARLSDGAIR